jgi:hypothetical protein
MMLGCSATATRCLISALNYKSSNYEAINYFMYWRVDGYNIMPKINGRAGSRKKAHIFLCVARHLVKRRYVLQ